MMILKLYKHADNIHLEGTVFQILYLGLGFDFMLKNGNINGVFLKH